MRFSLSHKLFAGFTLLSFLTILLGLTTFIVIKKMAESQESISTLREFSLRASALETSITAQSNAFVASQQTYENFRANLDTTRKLAGKILRSSYCLPSQTKSTPDPTGSCQSIMIEAIDSYPQAAIKHYEKTLFTLRLINKNRYIYQKMLEMTDAYQQNGNKQKITAIIHKLEMLKHDFEESNNFALIDSMRAELPLLQDIEPSSGVIRLAQSFIDNSEQTYLNRLAIDTNAEILAASTNSFRETSLNLHRALAAENVAAQKKIYASITLLGLISVALTLIFWFLTSRRLTRFLNNQKKAIGSIKSGNYDYTITDDSNDELSELTVFTKSLAINLKEEIGERRSSQQEKEALQTQLMQAQRLESIGMLAGGIAHDFNNIMTGITGYTDLALARLEDDHPAKRYLETIAESGQKAREMTRQLQSFSKKQALHKQVTNLPSLIANLSKMLHRIIGENIILEISTSPDLPNVMADVAQIEQVLMNMAVNAKDAMPDGGKLTIKTAKIILNESAVNQLKDVDPGDFVQIAISDNGTGMTEETKEKIFDPFFSTKERSRGSGLGLATSFGIIKQHNGHVTVESVLGEGTTFNFYLPALDGLPAEYHQPFDFDSLKKGRETILVVDDNSTARAFICDTLEYCGYKLLTASSGREATKILHQTDYPIDLLLTDVVMPGLNGPELSAIAKEINPQIKVIFMSGYNDLSSAQEKTGASSNGDFLKKPMQVATLSLKVREVLDR